MQILALGEVKRAGLRTEALALLEDVSDIVAATNAVLSYLPPTKPSKEGWLRKNDAVHFAARDDQPERGEQYAHDLPSEAIRQLSDPRTARAVAQKPCWPRGFF